MLAVRVLGTDDNSARMLAIYNDEAAAYNAIKQMKSVPKRCVWLLMKLTCPYLAAKSKQMAISSECRSLACRKLDCRSMLPRARWRSAGECWEVFNEWEQAFRKG